MRSIPGGRRRCRRNDDAGGGLAWRCGGGLGERSRGQRLDRRRRRCGRRDRDDDPHARSATAARMRLSSAPPGAGRARSRATLETLIASAFSGAHVAVGDDAAIALRAAIPRRSGDRADRRHRLDRVCGERRAPARASAGWAGTPATRARRSPSGGRRAPVRPRARRPRARRRDRPSWSRARWMRPTATRIWRALRCAARAGARSPRWRPAIMAFAGKGNRAAATHRAASRRRARRSGQSGARSRRTSSTPRRPLPWPAAFSREQLADVPARDAHHQRSAGRSVRARRRRRCGERRAAARRATRAAMTDLPVDRRRRLPSRSTSIASTGSTRVRRLIEAAPRRVDAVAAAAEEIARRR